MTMVKHGLAALTEKEKAALRLMVRGHDAKSIARTLGLSVHTINERLRDARRKTAVSSSREAARLLFESEGGSPVAIPQSAGDEGIGGATASFQVDNGPGPTGIAGRPRRFLMFIGALFMLPILALLTIAIVTQVDAPAGQPSPAGQTTAAFDPAAAAAAQRFLTLIDHANWDASYALTGVAFRKVNSVKLWADTSVQARAPFGAVIARTQPATRTVAAPPAGYTVVTFVTQFANRSAIEAVTLDREDGDWRVVGITID